MLNQLYLSQSWKRGGVCVCLWFLLLPVTSIAHAKISNYVTAFKYKTF